MASTATGDGDEAADDLPPSAIALGPNTAKYLDDKAAESFKRQVDLEESIWRSLPLFTGALIVAATLLTKTASSLPPPAWAPFAVLAYGALIGSGLFFAAAFWWLWQIVRPRDYDFPADDAAVVEYAKSMAAFHGSSGAEGEALDALVLAELRSYMTETLGKAAKSTFGNNQVRLSARSQVLVWLLWGFVLSFAAEAVVYGHDVVFGSKEGVEVHHAQGPNSVPSPASKTSTPAATVPSAHEEHSRRGVADKDQHDSASPGKVRAGHER